MSCASGRLFSQAVDNVIRVLLPLSTLARDRHQKKQVEEALRAAEDERCTVEVRHSGHTWGHVVAPNGQRLRVWSTPKDPDAAARIIRRFARNNQKG